MYAILFVDYIHIIIKAILEDFNFGEKSATAFELCGFF